MLLATPPSALLLPIYRSEPVLLVVEFRVIWPVKTLLPVRSSALGPVLMNPLVPAITPLMVAICVALVPVPTVITGWLAPLSSVRMFAGLALLSSVQLKNPVVVSANFNWPIVLDESRLTVALAPRLRVEKSAMPEAPVA